MVIFVNVTGTVAPRYENNEQLVRELENKGYDLESKGDFNEYL